MCKAGVRRARRADIPALQRVRASVSENRLTSTVLSTDDYIDAIERKGRGWLAEVENEVVGFAVGNAETGNVWALFVDPAYEGRGYGRELHDVIVSWLWSQGLETLWLTTEPGTRAQRFYEAAGWTHRATSGNGEYRYEMDRPADGLTITPGMQLSRN
jgi:GNAT superfamily N-acetyltransferase